jgi:hypothetical protein
MGADLDLDLLEGTGPMGVAPLVIGIGPARRSPVPGWSCIAPITRPERSGIGWRSAFLIPKAA